MHLNWQIKINDFDDWYHFALDNWESISLAQAELERQTTPSDMRSVLIYNARKLKLDQAYARADAIAQIVTSLKLMNDTLPHGKVSISSKEYDLEVEYEW